MPKEYGSTTDYTEASTLDGTETVLVDQSTTKYARVNSLRGVPTAPTIAAETNAPLNSVITSDTFAISGPAGVVWPLTIRGTGSPQLSVDDGATWDQSANAINGDNCKVRLTSSGSLSTMRTATLYFPGGSTAYNVTTTSYSPASSGTLAFWLDPSDPSNVTLSGSDITALEDTSGNNRDPVLSSTKPTYLTGGSGINGLGAIRTAAGSSYFAVPSSVLTAVGNSFTLIFVVRTNQTGGYVAICDSAGRNISLFYSSTTGFLSYYGLGGSQADPGGSQPLPNGAVGIVTIRMSSAGVGGATIYANGKTTGSTVTTSSITAEDVRFGDNPSGGGSDSNADYGEILFFDSDIGDTEARKAEGYAAHKYGAASALPADHPYKASPP